MHEITFQYIAPQGGTSSIPILDNIVDFDLTSNNIKVLYDNTELINNDNYTIDITNKLINLTGWVLNQDEKIFYRLEV